MEISTTKRLLATSIALLAAGTATWYGLQRRGQSGTPAVANGALNAASRASLEPAGAEPQAGSVVANGEVLSLPREAAGKKSFGDQFRAAGNYRQFVIDALPAARSGDAEAQYYISAALEFCEDAYQFYFNRQGRVQSVDEAIAELTKSNSWSFIRGVQTAYSRCHEISSDPAPSWGNADQWLAKATQAGQPVAQSVTALKVFLQTVATGESKVVKSTEPGATETYNLTDARRLVSAAVSSKRPEAIFRVGDVVRLLKPDADLEELGLDSLTWRYAACLRGLDCSAQSELQRHTCVIDSTCDPNESHLDYLRRMASTVNVYDIEQRARTLNEKVDAGDLDAIGLGG